MMMQSTTRWDARLHSTKRRQFVDAMVFLFPELQAIWPIITELLFAFYPHRAVLVELMHVIRTNTDLLVGVSLAFIELMRLVNSALNLCMWCYVVAEWVYVGFVRLVKTTQPGYVQSGL